MSSMSRETIVEDGSSVGELLAPCGDVVEARRIGDFIACVQDGAWLLGVGVVYDAHDCANSLSALVRLWGHDVQTAYNGAAALEMMGSRQPDVALVDLAMPSMDGLGMARRLRQQMRFNYTLLIAVTGYAGQAYRLLCDEAGFDHCLFKPIELDDLKNLLLSERYRLARFSRRE
jgi:two-component system OmpR family response regulator